MVQFLSSDIHPPPRLAGGTVVAVLGLLTGTDAGHWFGLLKSTRHPGTIGGSPLDTAESPHTIRLESQAG